MILLDTNVVSELMRPAPAPQVLAWFDAQGRVPLALSAVTVAEVRFGVARLPEGRRKSALEAALTQVCDVTFAGAVLPFDRAAAEVYGLLAARMQAMGRQPGQADLMIAAIAAVAGAAVATRNTRDFEGCGVTLHDPFASTAG